MPLLALLFPAFLVEPPRVLVAALAPDKKDGPVPSSSLGDQLANQFDEDGRTKAIVWSLTDPIFRPAALEGRLGNALPVLPTRAQALDAGRRLGATYVMVYRSDRKDGRLNASAELIQDGRTIWKDAQSMNALHGSTQNEDDTAGSIARTWVLRLAAGPLKALPPKKAATAPDATPGQAPVAVVDPLPAPPPTTNLQDLERRVGDLTKSGRSGAARAMARDAVDADPLSPGPRSILVRLLAAQGDAPAAAEEARRAADLMPDQPALRIDAARRLLAVGKSREAKAQAASLLARSPDDPAAHRLSAEVALAEDDAASAIRDVEPLLKAGDDPAARLLRGLARARLGGADGAAADLKAWDAATTDPLARAEGYAFARRTLGAMAERAADAMLPLIGRAGSQPKAASVRDELDDAQRQAQARAAAWTALSAPEGLQAQHDAWDLVHRLLSLVAADLRAYLGGNADGLSSAQIDLGEAKRTMKEARGKG